MRAAVDTNNARGDDIPTPMDHVGCCTAPMGSCNAPDSTNNGVQIDMVEAMCFGLGYNSLLEGQSLSEPSSIPTPILGGSILTIAVTE